MSRSPGELIGELRVGAEVTDWEPDGGKYSVSLMLASSGAGRERYSCEGGGKLGAACAPWN